MKIKNRGDVIETRGSQIIKNINHFFSTTSVTRKCLWCAISVIFTYKHIVRPMTKSPNSQWLQPAGQNVTVVLGITVTDV